MLYFPNLQVLHILLDLPRLLRAITTAHELPVIRHPTLHSLDPQTGLGIDILVKYVNSLDAVNLACSTAFPVESPDTE